MWCGLGRSEGPQLSDFVGQLSHELGAVRLRQRNYKLLCFIAEPRNLAFIGDQMGALKVIQAVHDFDD